MTITGYVQYILDISSNIELLLLPGTAYVCIIFDQKEKRQGFPWTNKGTALEIHLTIQTYCRVVLRTTTTHSMAPCHPGPHTGVMTTATAG